MLKGGRRRLRRTLVLAAGLITVVSLGVTTVTTSAASPNAKGAQKHYVIGYAAPILTNPVIAAAGEGMKTLAAKYNSTVIMTDAGFNAGKQASDIDSLVAQGVNAIIDIPVNIAAITPALNRARAKGVVVVSRDAPPQDPFQAAFNGSHFDAASAAAFYLAKKLGKGAKVAVIQGNPSTELLRLRNAGFDDGAQKAGLVIVDRQINFKDSADGARPIADAWKARFGSDLKGIFAYNDPSGIGAASAIGGGFNPLIVSMNGTPEAIAAIKAGQLAGTWDILGPEQGKGMAYVAIQLLNGNKNCPREVKVGFRFFDKTNVDSWLPYDQRAAEDFTIAQQGSKAFLLVGKGATQWKQKLAKAHKKTLC
jgi:ribose transport system substrate-binding protein